MINRKILYGYKIQNGEIVVYPTEAMIVNRTYTLYANGLSYQKISNILNAEKIVIGKPTVSYVSGFSPTSHRAYDFHRTRRSIG